MGFHENVPPPYTNVVWDMTKAPEEEQREALALLSGDASWRKGPKKIEVFVHDFCEYCGKHRNVSLIPMQRGWAWYCFRCQLRYLWRTRKHRKDIYKRVQAARQAKEE